MHSDVIIASAIFIGSTVFLGCHDPNKKSTEPASIALSKQSQQKAEADNLSGKWSWATPVVPAAPTKQIASLKRSGDSLSGKVIWLLDEGYSAEIRTGKTDGRKVEFDATFVIRDVEHRDVEFNFSYRGVLDVKKMRIAGTCTITGSNGGTASKLEYPWYAFPEP